MLVSIIIPCYNVEKYISACIESALNQTYPDTEIIIVDNNSTDQTLSIIRDFQRRQPEKISLLEETKQNASAARNLGLKYSKGEWLQFLDADDLLLPNKIGHQLNLISNNDRAVMIAGAGKVKHVNGKMTSFSPKKGDPYKALAYSQLGYTVANLFKKDALMQINGWDETLPCNQDLDVIFRLLKFFGPDRFAYDFEQNTMKLMRPSGQITTTDLAKFNTVSLDMRLRIVEYLEQEKYNYYQQNLDYFRDVIYHCIYKIGISSPELAWEFLKKELGLSFRPVSKKDNYISKTHALGVHCLGFKNYMNLRFLLKRIFSIFR